MFPRIGKGFFVREVSRGESRVGRPSLTHPYPSQEGIRKGALPGGDKKGNPPVEGIRMGNPSGGGDKKGNPPRRGYHFHDD
jgi:hypothetical protein